MRGFDGSVTLSAAIVAALKRLDAIFPAVAEHGAVAPYALRYPEDVAVERRVDAIYRSWKRRRLRMPIGVFSPVCHSAQDIFVRYSFRRFAFFVPALLADWASSQGLASTDWQIALIEEATRREQAIRGDGARGFTTDESAALASFFEAALHAALATGSQRVEQERDEAEWRRAIESMLQLPYAESCSESPYRPRCTNAVEGVLELACFYEVAIDPLLQAWLQTDTRVAETYLLDAVMDDAPLLPPVWTDERVRRIAEHVSQRFFAEKDPTWAKRLSDAEAALRAR